MLTSHVFYSLRKETNALGDGDGSGCTFATGYILYTGCFHARWHKRNSRRRRLQIRQTPCIVSCFISTCLRISAMKSNFTFKKVYPTNQKMGWPNALGRRSSWSETSWSDSVLAVASSQTMLSAKLPKSLSLGRCITFCRCKYCRSSSRNASALFDSTNSKLRSWKKSKQEKIWNLFQLYLTKQTWIMEGKKYLLTRVSVLHVVVLLWHFSPTATPTGYLGSTIAVFILVEPWLTSSGQHY